jgi:hypothetical protein
MLTLISLDVVYHFLCATSDQVRLPEHQNLIPKEKICHQPMATRQQQFFTPVCNINPYIAACYQYIHVLNLLRN